MTPSDLKIRIILFSGPPGRLVPPPYSPPGVVVVVVVTSLEHLEGQKRGCSTGEHQGRARIRPPQGTLAAAALTRGESPLTAQHNVDERVLEKDHFSGVQDAMLDSTGKTCTLAQTTQANQYTRAKDATDSP